jgi:RimJ/RimL family protein N-acetyltransferase
MACPSEWIDIARKFHADKLVKFPRYSFSSEKLSLEYINNLSGASPFRDTITRFDEKLLKQISGESDHFIDISAFDSVADFLVRGIGFSLSDKNTVVACAYSSLVSNMSAEVSIFVMPEYRCKGIATALACALIKACLERNADPHWDAANIESCRLAENLGYIQTGTHDAFFLKR